MLEKLNEKIKSYNSGFNETLIQRAFTFAEAAHLNQKRLSGEPMIHHAVKTAEILTDLKVNDATLAAALLHDVLEHTNINKLDIKDEFGEIVSDLVDGVSIIKKYKTKTGEDKQVENLRKLLLASARDVRVVLIRLAEKLHSLITLWGLPQTLQQETIDKAFEIYAPLAERLGVHHLKWQIEDWAFKHQNHPLHSLIHESLRESREEREAYIQKIKSILEPLFVSEGIENVKIEGRVKHLYSIYKKMLLDKKPHETEGEYLKRLHDAQAFRVLTKEEAECYQILGIVHKLWPPISDSAYVLKDYIAKPKPNGYRSLHTSVICEQGKIAEFQIKTYAMHEYNEFGPASHLYYKEIGRKKGGQIKTPVDRLIWLKNLVKWQKDFQTGAAFEKALKIDAFGDRVFIFTPAGDVLDLPKGATPVDFAYAIHSEIGHRTIGAKTDGKLTPLDYLLQNGQVCEILTSRKAKAPSPRWLEFVKTQNAKYLINKFFKKNMIK